MDVQKNRAEIFREMQLPFAPGLAHIFVILTVCKFSVVDLAAGFPSQRAGRRMPGYNLEHLVDIRRSEVLFTSLPCTLGKLVEPGANVSVGPTPVVELGLSCGHAALQARLDLRFRSLPLLLPLSRIRNR